jgi:hypothetical protein
MSRRIAVVEREDEINQALGLCPVVCAIGDYDEQFIHVVGLIS